jgi:molecular chaperone DnaK
MVTGYREVQDVMPKAIGIDLGTTNSLAAVFEESGPRLLPNAEGSVTTPSVVAFAEDGERVVGQLARRAAILDPRNTCYSVKRFIGRRFDEVSGEARAVAFPVVRGTDGMARFDVGGREYTPEEISALILAKLARDGGDAIGAGGIGDGGVPAVITVPAHFNDAQRTATRHAGRIAGLDVLRIINEPTAAALAYGLERREHRTALVFDLGGGTFDVSVLDVGEGMVEVRATAGDPHLGGDDFDRRLADRLAGDFQREYGVDPCPDPQATQRLLEAAEQAKVELSELTRTQVSVPFIAMGEGGARHLAATVTRQVLEEVTADLVGRLREPVARALADAQLTARDLGEVILVGGATRMPAVQAMVRELTGREPDRSVDPDAVVALGAAVQAGALAGEGPGVLLLDVMPLSLGLETLGGVMTRVIERNTSIPTRRTEQFLTAEDGQTAVEIVVLQGERERAADNRVRGRFRLDNLRPGLRGEPQIEVTFDIDADGILNVSAREPDTGVEKAITITDTGNLDGTQVDQMVADATAHRDGDQRLRALIDARNELESLAYQVERRLDELEEDTPVRDKARGEILLAEARSAIEEQAAPDRIRQLAGELREVAQSLAKRGAPANTGTAEGE